MAYIGQGIKQGTFKVLDTSGNTYNGSNTTFNLGTQVGSAAQLLVSHDGVIQLPGTDYTLASGGTQITFSTAPASGASIFIVEMRLPRVTVSSLSLSVSDFAHVRCSMSTLSVLLDRFDRSTGFEKIGHDFSVS